MIVSLFDKIKKVLKDKKLYLFFSITLLFFGILNKLEYATDTYSVFSADIKQTLTIFCTSGRFITAFLGAIVYKLNFSYENIYFFSYLMAIIFMTLTLYLFYKIIYKDIKKNIAILISILTILNIFSIELFLYIEKGIMILSLFFNVVALKFLIDFFEKERVKYVLVSVFFMLMANFCYQGTLALFVSLSVVYIIKYSKNIKEFLKNNIITALIYGMPTLLTYLVSRKMFNNSRISGEIIFKESIYKICSSLYQATLNTFGIMPKYSFLFFIIISIILCLVYFLKLRNIKTTKKVVLILGLVYINLGIVVTNILPQLVQNTASIWLVPRTIYSYASLIGIILLYLLINCDIERFTEKFIIIIAIIYLSFQLISFNKIEKDRYILNYIDNSIANQIVSIVNEYEENNNIKIKKLALYYDLIPQYTYNDLMCFGDVNIKAFYPDWSLISLLSFHGISNLERIQKSEEINNIFNKQNWNYFNEEQIIFENDIMHLCVF